jgi:hypothetical protein
MLPPLQRSGILLTYTVTVTLESSSALARAIILEALTADREDAVIVSFDENVLLP